MVCFHIASRIQKVPCIRTMVSCYKSSLQYRMYCPRVFRFSIRSRLTATEEMLKSNRDLDQSQIEANIQGLAVMDTCIGLSQFVYIIGGWTNRHRLITMMNHWTHMQRDLKRLLHSNRWNPAAEIGSYYLSIALAAASVLVTMMGVGFLSINAPPHPNRALELTLLSLIFSYYSIAKALKDTLVKILMYQ